jgi:uridine kinase
MFSAHERVGVDSVFPAPVVTVEQLFTLWWEEFRSRLHVKVFVDAPPDSRLVRRDG